MIENSSKKRIRETNTQNNNLDSFDINKIDSSLAQKIKEGEKEDISSMSTYNHCEEW